MPAELDEDAIAAGLEPRAGAIAVARAKATALAAREPTAIILAADTVVILDGESLGKPQDGTDARKMLERLRARDHEVVTAVCLRSGAVESIEAPVTTVTMRDYSSDEIAAYIATGSPFDKAGAYGIQDQPFNPVAGLDGCYCNVMGLPLWTVARLLGQAGLAPADDPDASYARCQRCPLR